jgi:CrcB protein
LLRLQSCSGRPVQNRSSRDDAFECYAVGLGGGLGSLLRWWTGRVVGEHYRDDFPAGTFLINVSGAFAIGYLSALFKVDWRDRLSVPVF